MGAERAALQDSGEQWSQLASSFEADIQHQPSLLKGGELRDYQMKVQACNIPDAIANSRLTIAVLHPIVTVSLHRSGFEKGSSNSAMEGWTQILISCCNVHACDLGCEYGQRRCPQSSKVKCRA